MRDSVRHIPGVRDPFRQIPQGCDARCVAEFLREALGCGRPSQMAAVLGLTVESSSWHPVTAGELEMATGRITFNSRAGIYFEEVIAHELGHYCLHRLGRPQSETFCREFAETLKA